jgi:hypothetical protein
MTAMATGAVLNNQSGVHGANNWRSHAKLTWQAVVRFGASIAVERFWAGMSNVSGVTLLGTDTPGTATYGVAAFRYSTAAGDTTLKAVTSNGATQTVADTGVTVAVSTSYKLEMRWDPALGATFLVNGSVLATLNTTLPAGTLWRPCAMLQTLEAVDKSIGCGWLYTEQE